MICDSIGLKIKTVNVSAKMIAIIRKYNNRPIGTIKKIIQQEEYVLLYSYTDRFGLKKIIACYDELKQNGINALLYELDDELTTIEFMKNLDKTYDEISDEIDAEN